MLCGAYKPGDHLAVCDVCGFTKYRSQLRLRWDGKLVCQADFEQRHPQDFVKGVVEHPGVLDARPRQPDVFVGPGDVKPEDL